MALEDPRAAWDRRWWNLYNERILTNGRRPGEAFRYAWKVMRARYGNKPAGSPSFVGLALRFFWLTKVKRMDWRKLLVATLGFGIAGAAAAIGTAASDGVVTPAEWWAIGVAGLTGAALYLKDPNSHRGPDVRTKLSAGLIARTFKK